MTEFELSTLTSRAQARSSNGRAALASRLELLGASGTRYALAGVIAWIGAMKFTAYEATAIQGLVASSPFLGWVYNLFSVEGFARVLGVLELGIALLIALKPLSPRAGALGSLLAIGMFSTTLSFLLSTPGAFEPSLGGFPALSALPGQFLIKDIVLLTAAVWTLGDSLRAAGRR